MPFKGQWCALLRDTTETSVLKKESRTEVLKWLDDESETRGTQPKEWLAVFDDLLSGCQQQLQTNFTLEQLQDIGRLHNLRCDFVHFTPKGWSILKADLPRIIGTALNAVEELMARPNAALHMDEVDRRR